MSFSTIPGQRAASERFLAMRRNGRMAHAYLICGPAGVGKWLFAWEMAKAILCPEPAASGEACDRCRSCVKVAGGNHPETAVLERRPDRQDILVEQVEALREEWFALRPVEGERKVCIVRDADRMNEEVANRLLKILEEPSGDTVFLLTTARPEVLLDTVVSRCQVLRLRLIGEQEIFDALTAQHPEQPAEEVRLAARLAGGSIGRAQELLEGDLLQRTRWAVGEILKLTPGNVSSVMAELSSYTARRGREKLEEARRRTLAVLDGLVLHWKDQLVGVASGETGERGVVPDGPALAPWQLEALIEAVLEAEQRLLANVNMSVLLQELLTKLAGRLAAPMTV